MTTPRLPAFPAKQMAHNEWRRREDVLDPCPKCGSGRFSVRFSAACQSCPAGDQEHLHVTCEGCGFGALYAPIDAAHDTTERTP